MNKVRAYPLWLFMSGGSSLFFALIFTVSAIYRIQAVHLNPLQLVLVGTALEASCFVGEIPTGVLADAYSRRLSLIVGYLLIGAAFVLEGSVPLFASVLAAQVIWGIGYTFTSGAGEAWIADEIGAEEAGPAYLRGTQAGLIGTLLGTGLSVALASLRLNLPIVAGGLLFVLLGVVLALTMPEKGFRPASRDERLSWRAMGQTWRDGAGMVRRHPVLLTILFIGAIYGAASEGFDRLWQDHLLADVGLPHMATFKPIVWFGIIGAVGAILSCGATEFVGRRVDTASHRAVARALLAINALLVAGVVLFGLAGNVALTLGCYWLVTALRTTASPLTTAWLAQNTSAGVRATVFSMSGQADALGQIAVGPVVGAVGTLVSLRAAIALSGVMLSPALYLYARTLRRGATPAVVPDDAVADKPDKEIFAATEP